MLHLASQSPRRRQLLEQLGLDFGVIEVEVPEVRAPGEPALDYVSRVAREKAGAGLLKVMAVPNAVVLGADTEVILDDQVFGKPNDAVEAAVMLRWLSGRTHQAATAVWLVSAGREAHAVCVSEVRFAPVVVAVPARSARVQDNPPRRRRTRRPARGRAQFAQRHGRGGFGDGQSVQPEFRSADGLHGPASRDDRREAEPGPVGRSDYFGSSIKTILEFCRERSKTMYFSSGVMSNVRNEP